MLRFLLFFISRQRLITGSILALFAAQATAASPSKSVVLAIGSADSFKPKEQPLQFADLDAKRFAKAMEVAGRVTAENILTIINPSVNYLRESMMSIADLAARVGAEKLIVYYSGHSDELGFHLKDGLFPKEAFQTWLKEQRLSIKIAILDSCFAGALATKGVSASPAFSLPSAELDEPTGTVFLMATASNSFAYESQRLEGGIFTSNVLAGLYGQADANSDGVITVDELYQYTYCKRLPIHMLPYCENFS